MGALRSVLVLAAAAGLYAAVPACSVDAGENIGAEASGIETLDAASIVGAIAPGTTSAAIEHPGSPRYRALSFQARAGETLDAWVRSINGDAVAFITNARFKTLGTNDDASPTTHDAHVTATALETGTHYVVFRERDLEAATFRVSLVLRGAAATPGAICTTPDEIAKRACGTCGTQAALCEQTDPGAPPKWSEFSPCAGELPGGCSPGTVQPAVACGRCGTRSQTCTNMCTWNAGVCSEPPNACAPGSIEVTAAGCTAGTYRTRSCRDACDWSGYSPTCGIPTANITAGAVNDVDSTYVVLGANQVAPLLGGTCPNATLSLTKSTPYGYVRVNNMNARAVKASIWTSGVTGGDSVDTVLAAYAGSTVPATDSARKACGAGPADSGGTAFGGDSNDAALTGVKSVTIAPNSSVLVYVAAYSKYDAAQPAKSTGPVGVSVRVDTILP